MKSELVLDEDVKREFVLEESFVEVKLEVKEEPQNDETESSNMDDKASGTAKEGGEELTDIDELEELKSSLGPRDCDRLLKLEELRHWEKTGLGMALESGEKSTFPTDVGFRIVSYNVLAQKNLELHMNLYRNMSRYLLDWEYRWRGLRRELITTNPDIVALQEVQFSSPDHFTSHIAPWFERRGYQGVSKCRTGGKEDGCAIFFRKTKFSLSDYKAVEYKVPDVHVLDRDNVGLVCCLQASNGAKLVVGTTHLLFNPKRHEVRLAQVAFMLAELDAMAWQQASKSYLPTVLCGDFNLQPYSDCYNLIKNGLLEYEGIPCGRSKLPRQLFPQNFNFSDSCQWADELHKRGKHPQNGSGRFYHQMGFRSVHKHSRHQDTRVPYGGYEATTFHGSWVTVDYIFYSTVEQTSVASSASTSDGRREGGLKLVSRMALPTGPEISALGGLPSEICPSDHLPLLADFMLKKY